MVVAIQKFDQMIYLTHFTIVIDIGTTVIPLFLLSLLDVCMFEDVAAESRGVGR
jgi:hypothetical protein